ncbi:MAG: DUF86 domain-containing protein [Planctomycetes bacterium]|nr:DUF86 domain-containing protein [Planctomycetota bacterium]
MTEPRLPEYLEHIRQTAIKARAYVQGMDRPTFLTDSRTQDAVIRCLIVIGEATTKIMVGNTEFVEMHPEIPWREIRRMRNRLTHVYYDINLDTVWDVTQTDLPALLEGLPPSPESCS